MSREFRVIDTGIRDYQLLKSAGVPLAILTMKFISEELKSGYFRWFILGNQYDLLRTKFLQCVFGDRLAMRFQRWAYLYIIGVANR